MFLRKVTLTGIDEGVDPWDLITLTEEFPFVEWGVLFSRDRRGKENRYPGKDWLKKLGEHTRFFEKERRTKFPLSAHLCGHYAREVVLTHSLYEGQKTDWSHDYGYFVKFHRFQLNISSDLIGSLDLDTIHDFMPGGQIIIQSHKGFGHLNLSDYVWRYNDGLQKDMSEHRFSILFDVSGGTGLLPNGWDEADKKIFCGYAGGLKPENLAEQLPRIEAVAGNANVWIDMESGVRENDRFSLEKARAVLEHTRPLIS